MDNNSKPKTIYICSVSKVPEKSVYKHLFGYFAIEIAIDTESKTIKDFIYTCPFADCLSKKEIKDILIEKNVSKGISEFIEWSKNAIICPIQKAKIAAFKDILNKWNKIDVK